MDGTIMLIIHKKVLAAIMLLSGASVKESNETATVILIPISIMAKEGRTD